MPPPRRETRIETVDAERPDPRVIAEAASVLAAGGLVAFPTETVYGLGAHALDPAAVTALFEAKGRPSTDPVIVHVASLDHVAAIAREIPPLVERLALRFWPGPLTLVLHKQPSVSSSISAGLDTVGVRVPAHPVAQALLRAAAFPIAAPSANRFSRPSPTTAEHVREDLSGAIDLILDGGSTEVGVESTVLDLTVSPPLVRRPGGVSIEELRTVVSDVTALFAVSSASAAQLAPGQLGTPLRAACPAHALYRRPRSGA